MLEVGKQYRVKTLEQLTKDNYMDEDGDFWENFSCFDEYDSECITGDMKKLLGSIVDITRKKDNYFKIKGNTYDWEEWMFDLTYDSSNETTLFDFTDIAKYETAKYESETIKIKYHSNEIDKLAYIDGKSDWIDLRSSEHVEMKAGDFKLIKLGVSMELPKGYEAHIVPRSSTFKNFGILQTNHMGVVDETYCGNNDVWMMPALAMRDTVINVNDRICQFRIEKHQPHIVFDEVDHLENEDRNGIGSTGKQ